MKLFTKILFAALISISPIAIGSTPSTGASTTAITTTSIRIIDVVENLTMDFSNCLIEDISIHHISNTDEQNTLQLECFDRTDTPGWDPVIASSDLYAGHILINDDFHIGYPQKQCRLFVDDTTYSVINGKAYNHRHMIYKCKAWPI